MDCGHDRTARTAVKEILGQLQVFQPRNAGEVGADTLTPLVHGLMRALARSQKVSGQHPTPQHLVCVCVWQLFPSVLRELTWPIVTYVQRASGLEEQIHWLSFTCHLLHGLKSNPESAGTPRSRPCPDVVVRVRLCACAHQWNVRPPPPTGFFHPAVYYSVPDPAESGVGVAKVKFRVQQHQHHAQDQGRLRTGGGVLESARRNSRRTPAAADPGPGARWRRGADAQLCVVPVAAEAAQPRPADLPGHRCAGLRLDRAGHRRAHAAQATAAAPAGVVVGPGLRGAAAASSRLGPVSQIDWHGRLRRRGRALEAGGGAPRSGGRSRHPHVRPLDQGDVARPRLHESQTAAVRFRCVCVVPCCVSCRC